jgi:hypothetical protein
MNVVLLRGVLSRSAERRTLPSGSTLVAYEVTTRGPDGTHTVPVVWVDAPGTAELDQGVEVMVRGLVRRRYFRAAGSTGSRTEVVADAVIPTRQRRRVQALLEGFLAQIPGS